MLRNNDNKINSIIGPEVEVDGDVRVVGSILIYGKINGGVKATGSVRTAKGSKVKGDIVGKEAHICGLVEGNLAIDGKIILGSESQLTGNLKSGTLVIEEGAKFAGSCDMSQLQSNQENE